VINTFYDLNNNGVRWDSPKAKRYSLLSPHCLLSETVFLSIEEANRKS